MEVWPENWPVFQLFLKVSTQWRVGVRLIGLDYCALYPLIDRAASSPVEWDELFDDVRAMELAALKVLQESE